MVIQRISLLVSLFILMIGCQVQAAPIDDTIKLEIIQKLFGQAKKGDWILTEAKKGYQTKTKVLDKQGSVLTLEMQNIIKSKVESKTIQKVDLSLNKIIEATVFSGDGSVLRVVVDDLLFNKIQVTKYKKIKEERISVRAGEFDCDVYKAIVDDKVVLLWINESIPVNQIVKAKIKHSYVRLIAYGNTPEGVFSKDVVVSSSNG